MTVSSRRLKVALRAIAVAVACYAGSLGMRILERVVADEIVYQMHK